MQCAARLKPTECIKSSDVLEIAGILNEKVITNIIDTCGKGSFEKVETCVQVSLFKIIYQLYKLCFLII